MIGTPVKTFIRTIPKSSGWMNGSGEMYYDLSDVPWEDRTAIREELDAQGFYVQEIIFSDPMPVQVGMELRKRYEAEQEKQK